MVIGEAENGEQALALCAQEVPDLIILDLSMQGISGLDTLRILRTEQTFSPRANPDDFRRPGRYANRPHTGCG